MTDIFSHILIGYAVAAVISPRYDWFNDQWITVVLVGAMLPDLDKIGLVLSESVIQQTLGIPFSWEALHLPVGTLVVCGMLSVLAGDCYRRRVFGLLLLGAATHYLLDAFAVFTAGYSYPFLWPLWWQHFPAGGVYQSSDQLPVIIAGGVAAIVYLLRRY
jgi:membrane-bound metal-dependent hydrolase YbcI (DUF457 family)